MNTKKTVSILSLIVAASFTLTACTGTTEPTPTPNKPVPVATTPAPANTPDEGEQISSVENEAVDITLTAGQTSVEHEGTTYTCEEGAIAIRIKQTVNGIVDECVYPVDDEIGGLIDEHVGE